MKINKDEIIQDLLNALVNKDDELKRLIHKLNMIRYYLDADVTVKRYGEIKDIENE